MLLSNLSEVCAWRRDKGPSISVVGLCFEGRIPMAQATATSTDELLSQLAASEIDRLLSEADAKNPTPAPEKAEAPVATAMEGTERTALLEAAGFESARPESAGAPKEPAAPAQPPVQDERSALLQAAGFESPDDVGDAHAAPAADAKVSVEADDDRVPIYLKPLVWLNIPFETCPSLIRQMLGRAGIVTLVNAIAVLTYVLFFKKH